VKNIW